jgi:hypothetical protein
VSTYRASVRVEDDVLHTSRPLTAPAHVQRLLETVALDVADPDTDVTGVELVVETAAESETPIADSIAGTSSTPLHAAGDDDDDPAALTPATVQA